MTKLIEQINEAHMQVHLEELKTTDPELYKATLLRIENDKIAEKIHWELLKDIVSNILKKS